MRFATICSKNQALKKIIISFNLMERKIQLLRPILSASEPEGNTCTLSTFVLHRTRVLTNFIKGYARKRLHTSDFEL